MPETAGKSVSSLLSNDLLHRVERLRVQSNRRFTDRRQGEHLSGRGGSSTEFADYRDYAPGDDLRFVDWNAFSRLRRPYLKLYRVEEVQNLVLLLDASSSMKEEGKFDLARRLAAALGVMGLHGGERVSAYAFNDARQALPLLKPATGRPALPRLLHYLEGLDPGGNLPLERGIEAMLSRHHGRGIVVLLSDCLTFGDVHKAFNLLLSRGLEVFTVQILGPSEIEPQITGDVRLVDCESDDTLDVTAAGDLLSIYHEYREALQADLEQMSRLRGGRYLCVRADAGPDWIVLDLMRRRGWVR